MFLRSLLLPSSGRKKSEPKQPAWCLEDSSLDVSILAHNGSDASYLWIFTYLHKVQAFSSEVISEPHIIEVRWDVNKDMIHDCIFILWNDFLHEEIEPVIYALCYWPRIKSMKNLTKHKKHKLHIQKEFITTQSMYLHSNIYSLFFVWCLILEDEK